MKESPDKNKPTSSEAKKEATGRYKMKSSRRPGDYKPKPKKEVAEEPKNPIIRAFYKTGYTVWLVVLGIGIVLAFIVSVALL